jgi:hypothetical protein
MRLPSPQFVKRGAGPAGRSDRIPHAGSAHRRSERTEQLDLDRRAGVLPVKVRRSTSCPRRLQYRGNPGVWYPQSAAGSWMLHPLLNKSHGSAVAASRSNHIAIMVAVESVVMPDGRRSPGRQHAHDGVIRIRSLHGDSCHRCGRVAAKSGRGEGATVSNAESCIRLDTGDACQGLCVQVKITRRCCEGVDPDSAPGQGPVPLTCDKAARGA